jgi:hypothetical protein
MRFILRSGIATVALLLTSQAAQTADSLSEARKDVQLRAMLDEMARSKTLQLNNLDKPYFVEYDSGDTEQVSIVAELGGLLNSNHMRFRVPRVQVRVGDYKFDNTNSIYSGDSRVGTLPIDDDYSVMRGAFWLDTDAIYKAAADQISRKRNALREISDPDKTPDFSPATAIQVLEKPEHLKFDQKGWEETLRKASAGFVSHPEVTFSSVRMRAIASTYRLVNTEGTIVRIPQNLNDMALRAEAQTADGSYVWDHKFFTPVETSGYPTPEELAKAVQTVATETELLAKAPLAEDYSGPVLFEQEAAAEMVASVMADALRLHRKPLAPPGADTPQVLDSVWSGKFGAKVVPDWMSIYDDPAQSEFKGTPLAGAYRVDDEGVPAQRVLIADKGTLKALLTSREPVRDINISNGHGRLSGGFGSQVAVIGNLFVQADSATPEAKMKARLIEKTKAAGMKYGILLRRLDFPFTARVEELQGLVRQLQKSGYARTLASPLLAYRVYLDGHEELVRGFRFKEFSAKDLRDVDAASDKPYVLNYVNNGSPFDFADITSEATTSSVICPSLLFDSIDLVKAENEGGKLPIVPMPAVSGN